MKRLTLFTCLLLFTSSIFFTAKAQSDSDKGVTLDFDNYQINIGIMQEYVANLNKGKASNMNDLFAEDAVIVGLGGMTDTLSKKEHLVRYNETFKDNTIVSSNEIFLAVQTDENASVPPGEYAFGWGTVVSTNKATKKSATTSYHVVAHIVNGKMAYLWHYYDTLPFVLRDGATIMPPK